MSLDLEDTVSTVEIRRKLEDLSSILTCAPGSPICDFAKYFSATLEEIPTVDPISYCTLYHVAIEYLKIMKPYHIGNPVEDNVVSYLKNGRSEMYDLLHVQMHVLTNAVCPPAFADKVKSIDKEARRSLTL